MIFEISENLKLFYRVWEPAGDPVGQIVIIHGYGEHGGRYEEAALYLTESGFKVYVPDLPGHGKTGGKKGLVENIDDILDTIKKFIDFAESEKGNVKMFLFGHSMGGALSLIYAAEYGDDIDGVITSGAAVYPLPYPSRIMRIFISFTACYFPFLGTIDLNKKKLSTLPETLKNYSSDPLNYNGKVMAKTASEFFRIRDILERIGKNISIPVLFLHGKEDTLASPEGSKMVFDSCISEDKSLKLYPDCKHEILNDSSKKEVLEDIRLWLVERV